MHCHDAGAKAGELPLARRRRVQRRDVADDPAGHTAGTDGGAEMLSSATGTRAGNPPNADQPRGYLRRTINRFSADNCWSRWKTYALIRTGKLTAERIGGRLYISDQAAKAFDAAAASGALANAGK
jgi:hypothetical protein